MEGNPSWQGQQSPMSMIFQLYSYSPGDVLTDSHGFAYINLSILTETLHHVWHLLSQCSNFVMLDVGSCHVYHEFRTTLVMWHILVKLRHSTFSLLVPILAYNPFYETKTHWALDIF